MIDPTEREERVTLGVEAFVLRPARREEQPLVKAYVREEHLNPLSLDWQHFWLAEAQDGEIAACGQVKTHRDGSRELASLVVRPDWRDRGLAAAMISKLKAEGGEPLWLTCRSGLIPFYAKFGFVDATRSGILPPYFRRIRSLAGAFMLLAGAHEHLAVMVWAERSVYGAVAGPAKS
jgi:N-acetylglutamate synthase-like GNAT family acetyltransferase